MDDLNFHHLLAFAAVVRAGGVNAASRQQLVSASTISQQVQLLEQSLGVKLLRRKGRRVEPTEVGRVVSRYAEEVFSLGRELQQVAFGKASPAERHLRISAEMSVPKLLVRQLLHPVLARTPGLKLHCREGTHEEVANDLVSHRAEMVLTDRPVVTGDQRRVFHHSLGASALCLMGDKRLAAQASRRQGSIDGLPVLLPSPGTALRDAFERWAAEEHASPMIAAEFDDTALMKEFGAVGAGLVVLPQVVESVARKHFGLKRVRLLESAKVDYFAVTPHRRIVDPVLDQVIVEARKQLVSAGVH
ncbi:MAG: LysR family transcriptional regulator [Planctomycetes bacterium]|nr:LysR family transcriptional regulator [Planctomycetota bacterium]